MLNIQRGDSFRIMTALLHAQWTVPFAVRAEHTNMTTACRIDLHAIGGQAQNYSNHEHVNGDSQKRRQLAMQMRTERPSIIQTTTAWASVFTSM